MQTAQHIREKAASSTPVNSKLGVWAAVTAYLSWGLFPLYWKLLSTVPSLEIIVHRGLWSLVTTIPLILMAGRLREAFTAMRGRTLCILVCSATLLGGNWFLFTWAVNDGRVLETSLGNFIAPLCTIVLGMVFFKEKPRPLQWGAIFLAAAGVMVLIVKLGYLPWVPLVLGASLSLYGMLRKVVSVQPLTGVFIENLIFLVPSLTGIWYFHQQGSLRFGAVDTTTTLLLIGGGVLSTLPTGLYAYGAKSLKLTTLGLLHYVVPTTSFCLGVFVFHEPFTHTHFLAFCLIWLALVAYSLDTHLAFRSARALARRV